MGQTAGVEGVLVGVGDLVLFWAVGAGFVSGAQAAAEGHWEAVCGGGCHCGLLIILDGL